MNFVLRFLYKIAVLKALARGHMSGYEAGLVIFTYMKRGAVKKPPVRNPPPQDIGHVPPHPIPDLDKKETA